MASDRSRPLAARASLDDAVDAVRAQLEKRDVPAPDVLLATATGVGELPDRLRRSVEIPLGELDGVPEPWDRPVLYAGRLGRLAVWILEDLAGDPLVPAGGPPFAYGFPQWLAAAAGASVCVHTSAGVALDAPPPAPGASARARLAVLRDHLHVGGPSPLVGLGESRLGPLFPDLSRLHHLGLRHAALERAPSAGFEPREAIAACTAGPAQPTPAERTMLARLGAEIAVPGLAAPLLAAGHAGLSVLALSVTTTVHEATDPTRLVELASAAQPRLEELVLALSEDLDHAVQALHRAEAP